MACQRNRIIENLTKYFESLGIEVNIDKNSARGNKGIFIHKSNNFRIDISKNMNDEECLSVMLHEFAHYIHYKNDKTLKKLDFVFGNLDNKLHEELINLTIESVPKDFAEKLYKRKNDLSLEIKMLFSQLKQSYPTIKLTENFKQIENSISIPLKYLLKYDSVKYMNEIYSANDIDTYTALNTSQKLYIKLKFKQRCIKRLNSKISRLNKYYNTPTELFARFIESYYIKPDKTKTIAPFACKKFKTSQIPQLNKLDSILQCTIDKNQKNIVNLY